MYLGRLVELGAREEVCFRPLHPYTQALLPPFPGWTAGRGPDRSA
jgi:oligopeptide transport system ATP-binding protein